MCKTREAAEDGFFCDECGNKFLERMSKIEKTKQKKELKKVLAYVFNRTMQILRCDVCGCWYLGAFNEHNIGEPNVCCDHCVWVLTRMVGEPQPPHTCKRLLDSWLKSMQWYSCLISYCHKCGTLNIMVNERYPLQCENCGAKP